MDRVYIPRSPLAAKRKQRSKYGNKICHAQGRKFDSIIERDRFLFLQEEQRNGYIRNLRCQVPFDIIVEGQHICKYIADFVYEKNPLDTRPGAINFVDQKRERYGFWVSIVEDVKGGYKKRADFALKEKLMYAVHNVTIHIVKNPTQKT